MKTIKLMSCFCVLLVFITTSCSVEKRQYRPGYFVQLKHARSTQEKKSVCTTGELPPQWSDDETTPGDIRTIEVQSTAPSDLISGKEPDNFSIAENSSSAKRISAGKAPKAITAVSQQVSNDRDQYVQYSRKVEKDEPKGTGKNQLVAALLCFGIGIIGIHRFYLGYIGIGIAQILTLGGCGIWMLVDLILILSGKLKPKDGPYEKTLKDL